MAAQSISESDSANVMAVSNTPNGTTCATKVNNYYIMSPILHIHFCKIYTQSSHVEKHSASLFI